MASASASPQPPSGRSDAAEHGGRGPETGRRGGNARHERADEQDELYGPLGVERLVKEDGRVLIIYARRERRGE